MVRGGGDVRARVAVGADGFGVVRTVGNSVGVDVSGVAGWGCALAAHGA